jgi:hypothetical protein
MKAFLFLILSILLSAPPILEACVVFKNATGDDVLTIRYYDTPDGKHYFFSSYDKKHKIVKLTDSDTCLIERDEVGESNYLLEKIKDSFIVRNCSRDELRQLFRRQKVVYFDYFTIVDEMIVPQQKFVPPKDSSPLVYTFETARPALPVYRNIGEPFFLEASITDFGVKFDQDTSTNSFYFQGKKCSIIRGRALWIIKADDCNYFTCNFDGLKRVYNITRCIDVTFIASEKYFAPSDHRVFTDFTLNERNTITPFRFSETSAKQIWYKRAFFWCKSIIWKFGNTFASVVKNFFFGSNDAN